MGKQFDFFGAIGWLQKTGNGFATTHYSHQRYAFNMIEGGKGHNKMVGHNGTDWFYGGLGEDELWGNDGNDALYGGKGGDFIYPGKGNDVIDAGQDNVTDDIYINYGAARFNFGTDTIYNFDEDEDRLWTGNIGERGLTDVENKNDDLYLEFGRYGTVILKGLGNELEGDMGAIYDFLV